MRRVLVFLVALFLATSMGAQVRLFTQLLNENSVEEVSVTEARKCCEEVLRSGGFAVVQTVHTVYVYLNDVNNPCDYIFSEDEGDLYEDGEIIEDLFPVPIVNLSTVARKALASKNLQKFFKIIGVTYQISDSGGVTSTLDYRRFENNCSLIRDWFIRSISFFSLLICG